MQQKSEFPARARRIAVIVAAIRPGCGGGDAAVESTSPTGGNPGEPSTPSPASAAAQKASRTFSAAGDYDYHNSRNGDVKGRIRVR